MKVVKCDICKEEIPEDAVYKIIEHRFSRDLPHVDTINRILVDDDQRRSADICLVCWGKIYDFAKIFSEDPHIGLIREDGTKVKL